MSKNFRLYRIADIDCATVAGTDYTFYPPPPAPLEYIKHFSGTGRGRGVDEVNYEYFALRFAENFHFIDNV